MAVNYGLWVATIVLAHAFALFWLLKTWFLSKAQQLTSKSKPSDVKCSRENSIGSNHPLGSDAVLGDGSGPPGGSPIKKKKHVSFAPTSDIEAARGNDRDISSPGHDIRAVVNAYPSAHVESYEMEWKDMGCSYELTGKTKVVLQGIYGAAHPAEMHALMGPSGAGKSTFMDILAMRKSVGHLTGQLLLNGKPATKSFIRKTAYVPQEDNFVPTMTAVETLSFYASVILPPEKFNATQRHERVVEVLAALGLGHAHKTLVGGTLPGGLMLRGLSGGERKRLAVAAGILAAPAVLFLDEPTSGLDSFAALSVMGYLQKMARSAGQAVISTIHQPRAAIWQMFDTMTLLANGRLMYTGATDGMIDWFGSQGYLYDPNLHGVPSDWALDLVAVGFNKPYEFYGRTMRTEADLLEASQAFSLTFDLTDSPTTTLELLQGGKAQATGSSSSSNDAKEVPITCTADSSAKYRTGWLRQYNSLLHREFLSITRNPYDVAGRTLTFCWVGIMEGLLFYNLPDNGSSLRSRLNILFCILAFQVLMPYISMGLYTADKKFYIADATAKLYRPSAYYLAKVTATLPFQVICSLVCDFVVYGMAGLRPSAATVVQHGILVTLLYLISVQVLHFCAMLAPNQDTAFMMSLVWTSANMLLSGFFISFQEMSLVGLRFVRYVSALYYALEGTTILEFKDMSFSCDQGLDRSYLELLFSALNGISPVEKQMITAQSTRERPGCVVNANAVTQYFHFTRAYALSVGVLVIYWLGVHFATFMAMRLAARVERR